MTVSIYRSTDASAPALSGTVGSLIALLDACLVNGYGAKAALGWAKTYSGTNLAAYSQPAGTNQLMLRVDDTVAATSRLVGYESMTDVNTGTNAFPTSSQFSGGLYVVKSATADSTARPWLLVSNGKIIYLFVNTNSSATFPTLSFVAFGDITSYKASDAYGTVLIANAGSTVTYGNVPFCGIMPFYNLATQGGHYICRAATGVGGSTQIGKVSNTAFACSPYSNVSSTAYTWGGGNSYDGNSYGVGTITYPNPADGGLYLERAWLIENGNSVRGELPGLWVPCHTRPVPNHGDTWSGAGQMAGKTFEAYNFSITNSGQIAIETSSTW